MAALQEADYGAGRDYALGSPHLTFVPLRKRIENDLQVLVAELVQSRGECRVVEVGGGHGTFTDILASSGARVTVTEMSAPSAALLKERFRGNHDVSVVHDPDGCASAEAASAGCDLVIYVSVLHHIPDYLASVSTLVRLLTPGGAFYCAQDPLWYPRLGRLSHWAEKTSYLTWRLGQGDLRRGLFTRWRRLRGRIDENESADMVEYHVVRRGVDETALVAELSAHFEQVRLFTYWSTQSAFLHRAGERLGLRSTFGIEARIRREAAE